MGNAKRNFINAKVRMGTVRPTRIDQPLPTSEPRQGGGPAGPYRKYVMNDSQPGQDDGFQAGMAMDSYPEPMNQHREVDVQIALLTAAMLAAGVPILTLTLANGSAGDKIRIDWGFSNPEQEAVFDIVVLVNGTPFINNRWQLPYNSSYPIEFYRKMDTATDVEIRLILKPGAVLVPPLGNIRAWLIVDAYRGTYLG